MLAELLDCVRDYLEAPEDDTDLTGRVVAWLAVARGEVRESDTCGQLAGPAPVVRDGVLVDLLKERGQITTTQLARGACICAETARLYLRSLARRRIVRKIGDKRGTIYVEGLHFGDFAKTLGYRFSDTVASDRTSRIGEGGDEPSRVAAGDTSALSEVMV
jgi:hypothetical protein